MKIYKESQLRAMGTRELIELVLQLQNDQDQDFNDGDGYVRRMNFSIKK